MSAPGSARLASVNVLFELTTTTKKTRQTAIDKRPVEGPVGVGVLGLSGDRQMDTQHHGGPTQALYAYATEDLAWWSDDLGRDIPAGFFGENLTTVGIDLGSCLQGEQWRIGDVADPDHVIVEVTDCRVPCVTFAGRMQVPGWLKRFADHGESGVYLRVVKTGTVRAGAPITVLDDVDLPADAETIRAQFARVMSRS